VLELRASPELNIFLKNWQACQIVDKPDEDVDLLVDDVQGQDTEAVLLLDRAGRAVLEEGTLGHLGEHLGHRVRPGVDFMKPVWPKFMDKT
jgi:hypothetical protein